jgi:hypothetical protein
MGIPMNENTVLEQTFADLRVAIITANDLPKQTKRHWCSSVTGIGKAFDQPLELIPARYTAVRARMAALHHVPLGWTAKTLANHKSNTKAALLWFAKERGVPQHGYPLLPAWQRLAERLTDPSTRYRLLPFMRYCSATGVEPASVDEAVVDKYIDHRERTTTRPVGPAGRRILARLWNTCVRTISGWPQTRLVEPLAQTRGLPREDLPEDLRKGIGDYLAYLKTIRRDQSGQRRRPCKALTLIARERELMACVAMAEKIGIPVASLTSLQALIHPDVAERILDAYWAKDGETPSAYTINLAARFVSIAYAMGGLDEGALQRLKALRSALEDHREDGITQKNLELIMLVLTEGVWSRIVDLPEQLMRQARLRRRHAPVRAAVLAQIAVAVAILTVAPIRLGNLAAIRLGENLSKPGGPQSNYWLKFPKYDVKNNQALQFQLDDVVTAIINEYVHDFRPVLMRGSNADWLFPGESGSHKEKISFSTQIVERVEKSTGIRITVHQFRHAAGALILKHRPGEYELVRRILGHKSIQTTIKFYCSLETTQASEIFTDIIRQKLNERLNNDRRPDLS